MWKCTWQLRQERTEKKFLETIMIHLLTIPCMWKTDFGMTQKHLLGSWGFSVGSGVNNLFAMQDKWDT